MDTVRPIKVLIVDDSAVVRQVLSATLGAEPGIEVIGAAPDPVFAMERMRTQWPDVIVLDVEMPRMDGITFLKKIMAERPTPVVICSTLTEKGAATTMQALAAGAVSIATKPKIGLKQFLHENGDDLIAAVKAASHARVRRLLPASAQHASAAIPAKLSADAILPAMTSAAMAETTDRVVAIGTSTGGTTALEVVLRELPRVCPGIVVVQHMPEKFTEAFANRLNAICQIEVREARQGDRVIPGLALIAPGGRQMVLKRNGAQYHVDVLDGPPVNRHKPSVDVLFKSASECAGRDVLGIIMTGMGDDGARGMKVLHDHGARTIAQNEETCVVFGMPKEAIKLQAVDDILPLEHIARAIMQFDSRA